MEPLTAQDFTYNLFVLKYLIYRRNKNPFQKEKRTDGHILGMMGVGSLKLKRRFERVRLSRK
jgi:hypothetical protein